jgi:hypothetical protein
MSSDKSSSSYKLKIIDQSNLDEVFSTDLSRGKIYTFLSSMFVFTVIVTVLVLVFTPLKFYIPGYGNNKAQKEAMQLKIQLDSLSRLVTEQQTYADNVKAAINGDFNGVRDTTLLDLKKVETEDMNSILPNAEEIRKDAAASLKKSKNATGK